MPFMRSITTLLIMYSGRPKNSLEGGPAPLLDMYTLLEGVIQHEKDIYTPFAEGEVLAEVWKFCQSNQITNTESFSSNRLECHLATVISLRSVFLPAFPREPCLSGLFLLAWDTVYVHILLQEILCYILMRHSLIHSSFQMSPDP